MAVTLGPKVSQPVPDGGLPPQQEGAAEVASKQTGVKGEAKLGQNRADAKRDAQIEGKPVAKDGKQVVGEGALSGGTPLVLDAAAFKDLLIKSDGAALLGVLASGANLEPAKEVKGTAALEAFQTCKPLLGKPTGQPIGEAFDHPELKAMAAVPEALSEAGLRTFMAITTQLSPEALQNEPHASSEQPLTESVALTTRSRGMDEAGLRGKAIAAQFRKMQALTDNFFTKMNQQPLPPNAPAAVAKQLQLAAPQIAAATKQLMKAIEVGASKRMGKDTDIEIPNAEVVALEKALMPTTEKWLSLVARLQAVSANPEELQAFNEGLKLAAHAQTSGSGLEALQAHKHYELVAAVMPDVSYTKIHPSSGSLGSGGSSSSGGSSVGRATVGSGAFGGSGLGGLNIDTADIEACIYFIMMQSAKTETDMLRDQMKDMQASNAQKKALREKMTHMKEEQGQIDKALKEEFDYLVAQGAIAKDTEFGAYKAWRQVTWTPEGDAALQQPMPDLPDSLIFGPSGPVSGPAGPGMPEDIPAEDVEMVQKMAEKFGMSEVDAAYLYKYWVFCKDNGSTALGMTTGKRVVLGFSAFLEKELRLVAGQDNTDKVATIFAETIPNDTANPAGGEGSDAKPVVPPCTPERYGEIGATGRDQVAEALFALLNTEPLKSQLEGMVGGSADWLEKLTSMPYMNVEGSRFPDGIKASDRAARFKALFDKIQSVAPNSEAAIMMARLAATGTNTLIATPSFQSLAASVGGDPAAGLGNHAAPATDAEYGSYKSTAGDNMKCWDLASEMWTWLTTEEPFKSNATIQNLLRQIHEEVGDDSRKESFEEFFAGDDFDDSLSDREGEELLKRLFDEVNKAAPNSKAAAAIMAFADAEADGDAWDDFGMTDPDEFRAGLTTAAPAAPAPPATPPAGEPNEEDEAPASAAEIASAHGDAKKAEKEAADARADAERAVTDARDAASRGNRMLGGGQALEGEPGAKTGTTEDFALALQKVDDEMMALSDMNEMQQTRLQILMDRRAKLLETLSNVMKKMSQTKETLSANQK
jgi:hypothetical protein